MTGASRRKHGAPFAKRVLLPLLLAGPATFLSVRSHHRLVARYANIMHPPQHDLPPLQTQAGMLLQRSDSFYRKYNISTTPSEYLQLCVSASSTTLTRITETIQSSWRNTSWFCLPSRRLDPP